MLKATARIVPPSWMPSFDFSIEQPPSVSEVLTVFKPPGRVWEGATAPLPIKNWVSEANSLDRGVWGERTEKLSTGRALRARLFF